MKNKATALVILAITAIAAIVGLVLMFNVAQTGHIAKTQYYGAPPVIIEKTLYETCRKQMCNDSLQSKPTGRVNTLHNIIECKCLSTPETRWFSRIRTYG